MDNMQGLQWSLFCMPVTQTMECRKSESAGYKRGSQGSTMLQKHICALKKRSAQGHTGPSAVSIICCATFILLSKKEMYLQNLFFCLPASTYQIKYKDNVCDFMSLVVSILWKHSNQYQELSYNSCHAPRGCPEGQLHISFCWIPAAPAIKYKASQGAPNSPLELLLPALPEFTVSASDSKGHFSSLHIAFSTRMSVSPCLQHCTMLPPHRGSHLFSPLVFTGIFP